MITINGKWYVQEGLIVFILKSEINLWSQKILNLSGLIKRIIA